LSTDVQRADADHISLLGTKQSSLLLSIAAHTGSVGAGLTNYHSESLRKAASTYKDIEYCESSPIHRDNKLTSSPSTSRESMGWPTTRRSGRNRGIKSKGNDEDPEGPSSNGRVGHSWAKRMESRSRKAKDGEGSLRKRLKQAKSGLPVGPLVIVIGS